MPAESPQTVLINFRILPVSINKTHSIKDREKIFSAQFNEHIGCHEYPRIQRSVYVCHMEKYQLLPSRNYHNMLVYYTNIKRREVGADGKIIRGGKKKRIKRKINRLGLVTLKTMIL